MFGPCLHTVSWKSASTEDADMVVEEVKNQNQLSSDQYWGNRVKLFTKLISLFELTFISTRKKTSWSQFHHGLYRICLQCENEKWFTDQSPWDFSYAVLLPRWSGFSRTDVLMLILKTLLISHHQPYVCIGKLLCMQGYEMLQEFQSTISGSLLGYLLSGSWPKGSPYVIILCHILKFSE